MDKINKWWFFTPEALVPLEEEVLENFREKIYKVSYSDN